MKSRISWKNIFITITFICVLIYAFFQGLEHEKQRVKRKKLMEQVIKEYQDLIEREQLRLEVSKSGQELIEKMEEHDNAIE